MHAPGSAGRPVVLTGFMGVGKTTTGRLVAARLERPFVDTDGHIEASSGRSVDDFFEDGDEPEFRRLEAAAVLDLLAGGPVVVALGGGALMDERSRAILLERSILVHLHLPWSQLRARLESLQASRPLLRKRTIAEVRRLYLRRLPAYRQAPLQVGIGGADPGQAADRVLAALLRP